MVKGMVKDVKAYWIAIIILLHGYIGSGQNIRPMDGETMNYTQIMFEVPRQEGANKYRFYFAACNKRAEQCLPIYTYTSKYRAALLSEPFEFGQTYKWYYEALKGKKVLYKSNDYLFYTGKSELVDTLVQKVIFTKVNKSKDKGVLIVDGLKVAMNMQGKPLLYLNYKYDHAIRDINLTPQGTLTLVDNRLGEIRELKLNGEMIWFGPTKHEELTGRSDRFHHEFEKLPNGNYLAAGKKKVSDFDESAGLMGVPDNTLCETIVEFDAEKNEVWRFDLLPELKRQFDIAPTQEMFNPVRLGHLNGMAMDRKGQTLYASFKTFNTVMKINRTNNQIVYQYGLKRINFLDSLEEGLSFEQQHAPTFNKKGNLLIFNNGNPKTGSGICELLVGDQVDSSNEVVQSIYFKDVLDKNYYSPQMGSVQEKGKNEYLICMGTLPHFFEFNAKSKKLKWQAYAYQNSRWQEGGKEWKPLVSYRVNYYSSLYPYYFVADRILVGKDNSGQIEIANMGTEDDVYQILLESNSGGSRELLAQLSCKSGKSVKFLLKPSLYKKDIILYSVNSKKEMLY